MLAVYLDSAGRLMLLHAVPLPRAPAAPPGETDWNALFAAAGLDIRGFEETRPEWAPPMSSSSRKAWRGNYPGQAEPPVRVEAASLAGRPVYFRIIAPWMTTAPGADEPEPARAVGAPAPLVSMARGRFATVWWWGVALLAGWLAWRNIRSGRGDRRGAFRIGAYVFVVQLVQRAAIGNLDHAPDLPERVLLATGVSLCWAFLAWLAYIGLEPLVRRIWPQSAISWSRMLTGRLRDPLLGRDILAGVFAGCATDVVLMSGMYAAQRGSP